MGQSVASWLIDQVSARAVESSLVRRVSSGSRIRLGLEKRFVDARG